MYYLHQLLLFIKFIILFGLFSSNIVLINSQTGAVRIRICIPNSIYDQCLRMSDNVPGTFSCINARDKFECMRLIDRDEADVVNLDAEDIYLAGRLYGLEPFILEENNGQIYKNRSGVLIPRNSNINTIADLRGKNVCMESYGMTAGWNIQVGMLLATDTLVPDCRGELHSVERFFGMSCAAGQWSNDAYVDQELKKLHPNLCSLCKDPTTCSSSDAYSGTEGAIKCVTEGQGQVAFTTLEAAETYFRDNPADKENYQFLCIDGSRTPISRRSCDWSRIPSNAFVIGKGKGKERLKDYFLRILQQIFFRFSQLRPSWFTQSFVSSENVTQLVSMPFNMQRWDKYLGNYIPSIEKPLPGCERKNLTFCLTSSRELSKCLDLQKAAFARRIRPQIRCHSADSRQACIDAVNNRKADIITLDSGHFYHASRYESLLPIATETTKSPEYSVAVVKSNSGVTSLSQLRGQRSCHTGFGQTAGWIVPVGALLQDGDIQRDNCNRAQEVAEFFSASCVPGAADARINSNGTGAENLCSQCVGDDSGNHACDISSERFSGEEGAFRCLVEGRGDVAFISHKTIFEYTDGRSEKEWAKNLRSSDYRLLCRTHSNNNNNNNNNMNANTNNGNANNNINSVNTVNNRFGPIHSRHNGFLSPITEYEKCNIAKIPPQIIATSSSTPSDTRFEAQRVLSALSDAFASKFKQSFDLFGSYRNATDLIFTDTTDGIEALPPETTFAEALGEFLPLLEDNDPLVCALASNSNLTHHSSLFLFLLMAFNTCAHYLIVSTKLC